MVLKKIETTYNEPLNKMAGEKDLDKLLQNMNPVHNTGNYVFCSVVCLTKEHIDEAVFIFKEAEGNTIVLRKETADLLDLHYSFIASWITLDVHSSLEAVGLTALFSKALADKGIGCNVVAAYYHDHIFVSQDDTEKTMDILKELSI